MRGSGIQLIHSHLLKRSRQKLCCRRGFLGSATLKLLQSLLYGARHPRGDPLFLSDHLLHLQLYFLEVGFLRQRSASRQEGLLRGRLVLSA